MVCQAKQHWPSHGEKCKVASGKVNENDRVREKQNA